MSEDTSQHPASSWGDGSSFLVTGRPTPPGGGPPAQYVESSQASWDTPSLTSTGLTPTLHALALLAQTHGMNRSEQAHGSLEEHMRQLFDTRNELFDNSNEPYVRFERFHGLVHGEPRELLAIKDGCCKDLASGATLSHRKSPFPSKDKFSSNSCMDVIHRGKSVKRHGKSRRLR
jgi:hypothetical protein